MEEPPRRRRRVLNIPDIETVAATPDVLDATHIWLADHTHTDRSHADPNHIDPNHTDPSHTDHSHADPGPGDPSALERGLRGLVGSGSSQVTSSAALRARDAARPRAEDLARAETELAVIRRFWTPRE